MERSTAGLLFRPAPTARLLFGLDKKPEALRLRRQWRSLSESYRSRLGTRPSLQTTERAGPNLGREDSIRFQSANRRPCSRPASQARHDVERFSTRPFPAGRRPGNRPPWTWTGRRSPPDPRVVSDLAGTHSATSAPDIRLWRDLHVYPAFPCASRRCLLKADGGSEQ